MKISNQIEKQRIFYQTGKTKSVEYRRKALIHLKFCLKEWEDKLMAALKADLGKSDFESYMSEIGMLHDELNYMIKNIEKLSSRKRVRTPLAQFQGISYRYPEPYGVVLVMSPWNYPLLLTLGPVVAALAAGNTVIIKPSEYAPHTSRVIYKMIKTSFPEKLLCVIEGGREVSKALLEQRFDSIFFTGGEAVGKIVLKKAARYMTPVTLELGGKSPCIIDDTANLKLAARRIVFGKFLNVGQTCVAPDYLLVEKSVKNELLLYIEAEIIRQYGTDPLANPDYGIIINEKHYQRLKKLLQSGTAVIGGEAEDEKRRIAPTVLADISLNSPIMQEEIFGPLLPVITYEKRAECFQIIGQNPTPLALYLFTKSRSMKAAVLKNITFGGGCINDTIIHLASTHLGFGGVGTSGMGSYHGKYGFDTFTHYKSIVEKMNWIDLPMRYQPYKKWKEKLVRFFMP